MVGLVLTSLVLVIQPQEHPDVQIQGRRGLGVERVKNCVGSNPCKRHVSGGLGVPSRLVVFTRFRRDEPLARLQNSPIMRSW